MLQFDKSQLFVQSGKIKKQHCKFYPLFGQRKNSQKFEKVSTKYWANNVKNENVNEIKTIYKNIIIINNWIKRIEKQFK